MKGRTVPILKNSSLQSASSYVQINIYGTNLKSLREKGVDVKHFLQHVGCRSVFMDVPIVTSEVKKSSRLAGRRLNKSFGGFTPQNQDSLLNESQKNLGNFEPHKAQHNTDDISFDYDNNREMTAEEVNATKEAFAESTADEVVRGPLTSTPMVAKNANSFRSFLSANRELDAPLTRCVGNCDDTNMGFTDKYVEQLSTGAVLERTLPESSFTTFSKAVMNGMKSMHGNETSSSNLAPIWACAIESQNDANPYDDGGAVESCDSLDTNGSNYVMAKELTHGLTECGPMSVIERQFSTSTAKCPKSSPPAAAGNSSSVINKSASVDSPVICPGEVQTAVSKDKKLNRRKRTRPASPKDNPLKENVEDTCDVEDVSADEQENCAARVKEEENLVTAKSSNGDQSFTCHFPHCNSTLVWRPRYGKNRLVDHVRVHWGKEVKQCKICDFKATSFRKVRHHHKVLHLDVPYKGSLSVETKEDINELLELWKKCFPSFNCNMGWLLRNLQYREWFTKKLQSYAAREDLYEFPRRLHSLMKESADCDRDRRHGCQCQRECSIDVVDRVPKLRRYLHKRVLSKI